MILLFIWYNIRCYFFLRLPTNLVFRTNVAAIVKVILCRCVSVCTLHTNNSYGMKTGNKAIVLVLSSFKIQISIWTLIILMVHAKECVCVCEFACTSVFVFDCKWAIQNLLIWFWKLQKQRRRKEKDWTTHDRNIQENNCNSHHRNIWSSNDDDDDDVENND